jgi:hypothetical protein
MPTQITKSNFRKALKKWLKNNPEIHALYLAPFFAIHEAEREKFAGKKKLLIWMWYKEKTVKKCLESIWQLTGEWQARRAITVKNRKEFNQKVTDCITNLAKKFNTYGILALRDMKNFNKDNNYEKIISEIVEMVKRISKTRPTKYVQPVLGSKVLHHFFPTIIPVYDDKMISKRVLKLESFKEFLKDYQNTWVFGDYKNEKRMQEYHHYLTYCSEQVCNTKNSDLNDLRCKIAELYKNPCPHSLAKKGKKSILWKLDAKIAEYCLIGATY